MHYMLTKSFELKSRHHSYKKKNQEYPAIHFTAIDYTNDITVITASLVDENRLLHQIEDTAKDFGLHINSYKT